ncbi:MAG: hypothetical protein EZS28_048992, partial [Streblomastix strix]
MCMASVVADCGLSLKQTESNAIRNLLIESARMGQEKNGIPPEKIIPHFYRIPLSKDIRIIGPQLRIENLIQLQDECSSVPLDAGTFGGRHVINDFLSQSHLKRKPKMLDIKEIQSSKKIDYSKHGAFLYDHIIGIRIIPSFFVTDALRHQVEALTPTNPDGYTKYITQIGKPLMPHSACMCHVFDLLIKHACLYCEYLDDQVKNVKSTSTELRKQDATRLIQARCPAFIPTRWAISSLISQWIARKGIRISNVIPNSITKINRCVIVWALFDPIHQAISLLERENTSVCEVFPIIVEVATYYDRLKLFEPFKDDQNLQECIFIIENQIINDIILTERGRFLALAFSVTPL